MKKVNWVLNSPDIDTKPPTKGTGYKMPNDPEEDPTGNEPPEKDD